MSGMDHCTRNDITGDDMMTKVPTRAYRENFDNIRFTEATCDCSSWGIYLQDGTKVCQECGAPYESE